MSKKDWVWMPHAAHLIVGNKCQFHLATYLGNGYLVSTIGEYWPERSSREIHAEIHDPVWHAQNNHLKGDYYDHAYMKQFGFEDIGYDRKYETMVFRAVPSYLHPDKMCGACMYVTANGDNLDFDGYNDGNSAYAGHMMMCNRWSRKRMPKDAPDVVTHDESMRRLRESMEKLKEMVEEKDGEN